jgi:hypothetical protein
MTSDRRTIFVPYYDPLGWWLRRPQTLDSLALLGAAYLAGVPLYWGTGLPAHLRARLQSAAADLYNAGIMSRVIARPDQLGPHQAFALRRLDSVRREILASTALPVDGPCWFMSEARALFPSPPARPGQRAPGGGNVVSFTRPRRRTKGSGDDTGGAA